MTMRPPTCANSPSATCARSAGPVACVHVKGGRRAGPDLDGDGPVLDRRAVTEEAPPNPIVVQQVEAALGPYRGLLPEEVLEKLGFEVEMMFTSHPFGVGLVARLSPALRVDVDMSEDPKARGFEGFALLRVHLGLMAKIRENARKLGRTDFVLPDVSLRVLFAFAGYLRHSDIVWQATEAQVREVARLYGDAVVATLFLGLIEEIEARPAALDDWGETGRAFSGAFPRARAVLRRALSRLSPRDRSFLEAYRVCRWDADRVEKRLRLRGRAVNERCNAAMTELGVALREGLESGAVEPVGSG
jgi:hypothetical protein